MLLLLLLLGLFCSIQPAQIQYTSRTVVAIVATNDIHGHALPKQFTRTDTNETYSQGGLPVLASLINIIKKEYPGNTLYFDSGDQFQGGFESSPLLAGGTLISKFMNYMELDGAAIGNHDFDLGYKYLETFLNSRDTTNLAANIEDQSGRPFALPKQQVSKLYKLRNGLKIGAIGLTTKFTPRRSNGWTLNDSKIQGLEFQDYAKIVETESSKLRRQGANAVILVSHVGDDCLISRPKYGLWTKNSDLSECNKEGEIGKLLKILPKGTLDAVLQGHYHQIVHNYMNGIPVLGNRQGGKYFNVLYLQFQGTVLMDTIIEGPIPVCERVFRNTMQCEYIRNKTELNMVGGLTKWKFHDRLVVPDQNMKQMMEFELGQKIKPFMQILCYNQKFLWSSYFQETELNNLFGMAVQSEIPTADFTLLGPNLLRQPFYPGPIRKLDMFNFHPFNSPFVYVKLKGKNLIGALDFIQGTQDSFHFSNELEQTVWMTKTRNKRGLISVKWYNGSEIDPSSDVTGIMHNFTLGFVEEKYNITRIKSFGTVRSVFSAFLRRKERIEKEWQLINPLRPKLIVKVADIKPQN